MEDGKDETVLFIPVGHCRQTAQGRAVAGPVAHVAPDPTWRIPTIPRDGATTNP